MKRLFKGKLAISPCEFGNLYSLCEFRILRNSHIRKLGEQNAKHIEKLLAS